MAGMHGVTSSAGRFPRAESGPAQLEELLAGDRVGLVLSDMSPNISGISVCDQARVMHLAELGLDFARQLAETGRRFLVKVFQGYGFDDFVHEMRKVFKTVASRASPMPPAIAVPEVYLLGKGLENLRASEASGIASTSGTNRFRMLSFVEQQGFRRWRRTTWKR
jgi:23S rRNA (uridine2552-2'-O)-methyltransferase